MFVDRPAPMAPNRHVSPCRRDAPPATRAVASGASPGPAETQGSVSGRRAVKQHARPRSYTPYTHLVPYRLRIRRLGVRVPSGAPAIKAVTSGNAGSGLDSFPACAAIFQMVGPWCSDGARVFRNGLCRPVLTSTFASRPVWIMIRVRERPVHDGHPCRSPRAGGSPRSAAASTCGWLQARTAARPAGRG
jgi:hypothetical protein